MNCPSLTVSICRRTTNIRKLNNALKTPHDQRIAILPCSGLAGRDLSRSRQGSIRSQEHTERFPFLPVLRPEWTPVKYLAGNVHSFVYADVAISRERFLANLNGDEEASGFKGYRSVLQRDIQRQDVVPEGWTPPLSRRGRLRGLRRAEASSGGFRHWSVWQRLPEVGEECGPELFSFFYLGGENSALYQSLYNRTGISPRILAIIQPGCRGGNQVDRQDSFFHRVARANPSGLPSYLLHGGFGGEGFYKRPCWAEYSEDRVALLPERYGGLFALK
jgi:hypothetical protein